LSKGSKLSALKAALKDMEQKLMRAEQAHVNVDMKSSNYKEQVGDVATRSEAEWGVGVLVCASERVGRV
jgi:hypothetical protein